MRRCNSPPSNLWRRRNQLHRSTTERTSQRPAGDGADRDLFPERSRHRRRERPSAPVGHRGTCHQPVRQRCIAYLFGAPSPAPGVGVAPRAALSRQTMELHLDEMSDHVTLNLLSLAWHRAEIRANACQPWAPTGSRPPSSTPRTTSSTPMTTPGETLSPTQKHCDDRPGAERRGCGPPAPRRRERRFTNRGNLIPNNGGLRRSHRGLGRATRHKPAECARARS
jgi:hypothetical protein